MAEEPIEQIKTTNSWSKQNADQADVRKCKETKIRISKRKNAFYATISLFLDSPFFPFFFFTCGNHSYDEYAISKNMLLENMKKNWE